MILADDLRLGLRFVRHLPGLLRRPLTLDDARRTLADRLARRPADFLALARAAIYAHPASPYRDLLRWAGCEYGDLERLVAREGVEGALAILCGHGVYLTVDEFKGRRPVVRGGFARLLEPAALRNPLAGGHVPVRTGGSRSAGTPVVLDLAFVRDCAPSTLLPFAARGGLAWVKAHWQVPGSGAVARILEYGRFGAPPERWFSQVDPRAPGLHRRYRWSARALRWGGAWAGMRFPAPEHVPLEAPLPIARWMAAALRSGRVPHLHTYVSSAVRLCRAAGAAGLDVAGARFTVTGEPLTAAQQAAIAAAGATAVPRYGIVECGAIGFGCLAAAAPDEVHAVPDLNAIVQPGAAAPGALPPRAILLSSLRRSAPLVLLNVSMGDEAVRETRACGCPLERLGWATHLRAIRSHEKLTAGGMTFLDTDVIRVLEEVLPARFGGGPTDYQLVEDRSGEGPGRLRLLVHPGLGSVDERQVAAAFLAAVSEGDGASRVMGLLWTDAGLLQVERCPPLVTPSGKILHLHSRGRGS
jgi:hypothetical protein